MEIKNFQLSKYFWFNELVHTDHLEYLYQNITDGVSVVYEATLFARDILDECRELLGPMTPGSWYRCPDLNAKVKGALNSGHMQGLAVDYTRWNTWELVDQWGRRLAAHLKAKGKNFKIIIETKDDDYWLHIGKAAEPTLYTGRNGIYEKQDIA